MKKYQTTLATCLLIAVLAAVFPIAKAFAVDEDMSEQQIVQIRSNCSSVKNTLNQLHNSDALLRVNMGQAYESMLTKMMKKFESRVDSNGYSNKDLSRKSYDYEMALDTFRSNYIKYEQQLSSAIGIDCSKQPVAFYDAVSLARSYRKQVHADVLVLNSYLDQYQAAVDHFENEYQAARKGATNK